MAVTTTDDDLSALFGALADPTRREMLSRLLEGEATLNELAAPFEISLQGVSQHLKVLEGAGLVSRRRVAQSRPASLTPGGLARLDSWLADYRRFWEGSFERLDRHLERVQSPQEGR